MLKEGNTHLQVCVLVEDPRTSSEQLAIPFLNVADRLYLRWACLGSVWVLDSRERIA